MTDTTQNNPQLESRWVPVTDARGRTTLEMCWIAPAQHVAVSHAA